MKRNHRRAHFALWGLLGPLAVFALFAGVVSRKPVPRQKPPVVEVTPAELPPANEVRDR